MEPSLAQIQRILAYEAFIRRAAAVDLPFMLKGSYVTRQYFPNPADRIPNDLDWLYLENIDNTITGPRIFSDWINEVMEWSIADGVRFTRLHEDRLWRNMDYAMAEDFPTINVEVDAWIGAEVESFPMDISFNLAIEVPPVPLLYYPMYGRPFTVPCSVPLALQVSWKIHQSLVRLRLKDLIDLLYLVQHSSFEETARQQMLQALVNECSADAQSPMPKLEFFLECDFQKLTETPINLAWRNWYQQDAIHTFSLDLLDQIPAEYPAFTTLMRQNLEQVGLTIDILKNLPQANRSKVLDE